MTDTSTNRSGNVSIPRITVPGFEAYATEIAAVISRNQLVTGPHLQLFEEKITNSLNAGVALVSSGFAGLFLTIKALKIKKGRVLIPAAGTCFAIVNAVLASGNLPVFCDLDEDTLGLDVNNARELYREQGFDLIISPNHFGIPSLIDELRSIGVPVIEDAAQSWFTTEMIGCRGDATVCSFYPTKVLNAIDGGAVVSRDEKLVDIVKDISYYDHQLQYDNVERYNYRLANLHAAYGCITWRHLPGIREKLVQLKAVYEKALGPFERMIVKPLFDDNCVPARMLIRAKNEETAARLIQEAQARQIGFGMELFGLEQSAISDRTRKLCAEVVSVPFHTNMEETHTDQVIQILATYA